MITTIELKSLRNFRKEAGCGVCVSVCVCVCVWGGGRWEEIWLCYMYTPMLCFLVHTSLTHIGLSATLLQSILRLNLLLYLLGMFLFLSLHRQ